MSMCPAQVNVDADHAETIGTEWGERWPVIHRASVGDPHIGWGCLGCRGRINWRDHYVLSGEFKIWHNTCSPV